MVIVIIGILVALLTGGTMAYCGAPYAWSGFNTMLPPNSPSCLVGNVNTFGVFAPQSWHPGGVNSVFADGSVRFISETINAGNPAAPESLSGPSPYGVWGAFGTMCGGEVVSDNGKDSRHPETD